MTHKKHRLGLLGALAIAALAMAAFASSAQALLPQFVFKNKSGVEVPVLKASITGKQVGRGTLLVPSLNLEINCEKFAVKEGLILTNEDLDLSLLYEECTALEMPAPTGSLTELPCTVSDVAAGKPELKHITASALGLPTEFASGDYGILFEKLVMQINYKSGTGCPLPLKNVMKGEFCALIEPSSDDTVEPEILFSQAIQEACPAREALEDLNWPPPVCSGFKDQMPYGTNEAFSDATAKLHLTGEHEGFTLGVLLK